MAKKAQNNKVVNTPNGAVMEQTTIMDDSMLPSAEELAKLKSIEPNAITWIMERAEEEQKARIQFNKDNMSLAKKQQRLSFIYDFTALFVVALILLAFGGCSVYLLMHDKDLAGTIFAGVAVVATIKYIMGSKKTHND